MGVNAPFLAISNQPAHLHTTQCRATKKHRTDCTLRAPSPYAHPCTWRPRSTSQTRPARRAPPSPTGPARSLRSGLEEQRRFTWCQLIGLATGCGSEWQRRSAPPGAHDHFCQPWPTHPTGAPPPPRRGPAAHRGLCRPWRTARLWNGMGGEGCTVRFCRRAWLQRFNQRSQPEPKRCACPGQ